MARFITVGAAQLGPVSRQDSRDQVVLRLLEMLREAKSRGCDLVVFTECALTPFFPRFWEEDIAGCDPWFERQMPGPETEILFAEAKKLGIGFHLGFAERVEESGQTLRYNSSILVGPDGQIIGKYRKIHLPGLDTKEGDNPHRCYEKRYFNVGNLGFRAWRAFGGVVGMCLGNDRRWPETYRVLALQGAELIVLGYNTAADHPDHPELDHLTNYHSMLAMQSGAYHNGCFVVGVAKAGQEEGIQQIGRSAIIAPSGEVVTQCTTLGDELVVHRCNLDQATFYKKHLFNFADRRQIEAYSLITETRGPIPPCEPGQDLDLEKPLETPPAESAPSSQDATAIEKLFTEQYGYPSEKARQLAEQAQSAEKLKEKEKQKSPAEKPTAETPKKPADGKPALPADPLEAIRLVFSEHYHYAPDQIDKIVAQVGRALDWKVSQEPEALPEKPKPAKPPTGEGAKALVPPKPPAEPPPTRVEPPLEPPETTEARPVPDLTSEEAAHVYSVLTEKYGYAPKAARAIAERASSANRRWQDLKAEAQPPAPTPPVPKPVPESASKPPAAPVADVMDNISKPDGQSVPPAVAEQIKNGTESEATAPPAEDAVVIVPCPECEFELKIVQSNLLGRKARCPNCQTKFRLPESV